MPMSMSASDWTQIQRRKAGTQYAPTVMRIGGVDPSNKDIAPVTPPAGPSPSPKSVLIPCSLAGKPKTLRPASDWTNFTASQVTDYVFKSGGTGREGETFENQNYMRMRVTRLCSCSTTALNPKRTSCDACAVAQRLRM